MLLVTSSLTASELSDSSKKLNLLLSEHWKNAQQEQVFFRKDPDTFRMNGKLPSFSQTSRERREAYNLTLLKRLKAIKFKQLTKEEQITYQIFVYERQAEARSYGQLDHLYPFNFYSGFDRYFAGAPDNMSFLSKKNYDNYLISLADFPRYNNEHISNLREAIKKGHTHYCASFENYHLGISKHLVTDINESVFYKPMLNMPAKLTKEQRSSYQKQATVLIKQKVLPAYKKFYQFFTEDYMTQCRTKVGISELKKGDEYYKYLIEYYTTTSMSADEIHQLGIKEVARIREEMKSIISDLKFKGDFNDFIQFLRTDKRFHTDSAMDLIEKASYITRKMAAQLPKWFSVLPRTTFDIKPSNAGGYYVASDGSGTTSGTYFVTTKEEGREPLYTLEALTFHEAEPGHHFQSAIAQEVDMAEFRKTLYHSAFGEGWGLYSERLGKEMGFYQDPYSNFGRLTYEVWRACRLVVDTGMHAKGWSRQQAIDYMAENTGVSLSEVTSEIDRYITWPAQALSYKIGEIKIRELRKMAEDKLGEHFDIRTFHDQILSNGSLPLDLLEELTVDWIALQLH
ncbi:MAG: DUF885 domain-containing protein [Kangiella sp.]|nr:MAG: DUF885 domain-containing protein [Kangiella sp.]